MHNMYIKIKTYSFKNIPRHFLVGVGMGVLDFFSQPKIIIHR